MKQKIALLGYGAIGKAVHRLLLSHAEQVEVVAILVRDRAAALALAPQACAGGVTLWGLLVMFRVFLIIIL